MLEASVVHAQNLPIVDIQSIACGLPVLVSEQVRVAEHVKQTGAGMVVPLDLSKAASQLIALVDSLSRQRRYFCQNIRCSAQEYSSSDMKNNNLTILREKVKNANRY